MKSHAGFLAFVSGVARIVAGIHGGSAYLANPSYDVLCKHGPMPTPAVSHAKIFLIASYAEKSIALSTMTLPSLPPWMISPV